jgi:hypothetical protein
MSVNEVIPTSARSLFRFCGNAYLAAHLGKARSAIPRCFVSKKFKAFYGFSRLSRLHSGTESSYEKEHNIY